MLLSQNVAAAAAAAAVAGDERSRDEAVDRSAMLLTCVYSSRRLVLKSIHFTPQLSLTNVLVHVSFTHLPPGGLLRYDIVIDGQFCGYATNLI